MASVVKVTQVRSGAGRPKYQIATLRGLGLNKVGKSRILIDTAAIRGMIRSVEHLVVVHRNV